MTVRLETERLILRPPLQEDFEGWAAFMADPVAMRYLGMGVTGRAVAWRTMATMAGSWSLLGFGMFSVIEKSTGQWIGRLGPWMPEGWPGTEVGWGLLPAAWGKGYATEGATAAIGWAFAHLGWTEVIHCIVPENVASQGVARRLGARLDGTARLPAPADVECGIWRQTRDEWLARR